MSSMHRELVTIFLFFVLLSGRSWGQHKPITWAECQRQGSGTVTVQYFDVTPYVVLDEANGPTSIELDLMREFVKFVRKQYNVQLTVRLEGSNDFPSYYSHILEAPAGYFTVGPISVTEERKKLFGLTPPYMPDIQVLVSSDNIPVANTPAEFQVNFRGKKAVSMRKTTFEEKLMELKQQYLPGLAVEYVGSGQDIVAKLDGNKDLFAYLELSVYLAALRANKRLVRHNVFQVKRKGYGIAFKKGSDWEVPLNAFFSSHSFKPYVNFLIQKHLGADQKELLYQLGKNDSTKFSGMVELLNAENQIRALEIEKQKLWLNQNAVQARMLWAIIGAGALGLSLMAYAFWVKVRANKELAEKNEAILQQQEELRAMQSQLILAEKLSALGKLIASVSHEINTPISAIRSHTQHLQKLTEAFTASYPTRVRELLPEAFTALQHLLSLPVRVNYAVLNTKEERALRKEIQVKLEAWGIAAEPAGQMATYYIQCGQDVPETCEHLLRSSYPLPVLQLAVQLLQLSEGLKNIETSAGRTTKIMLALSTFRGDGVHDYSKPLQLRAQLEGATKRYAQQLARLKTFELDVGAAIYVRGDEADLSQVWHHLIDNALHALQHTPDATLRIAALAQQDSAVVTVTDNGPGLPTQVRERIWEPFVTSKPLGEGSGMGLFITRKIVELHGGSIAVHSEHGQTVFTLQLPLAVAAAQAA